MVKKMLLPVLDQSVNFQHLRFHTKFSVFHDDFSQSHALLARGRKLEMDIMRFAAFTKLGRDVFTCTVYKQFSA